MSEDQDFLDPGEVPEPNQTDSAEEQEYINPEEFEDADDDGVPDTDDFDFDAVEEEGEV